jgi:hypothetical protein
MAGRSVCCRGILNLGNSLRPQVTNQKKRPRLSPSFLIQTTGRLSLIGVMMAVPNVVACNGGPLSENQATPTAAVSRATYCYGGPDLTGTVYRANLRMVIQGLTQIVSIRISPFTGAGSYLAGSADGPDVNRPAHVEAFVEHPGVAEVGVRLMADNPLLASPLWVSAAGSVTINADKSGALDVTALDQNSSSRTPASVPLHLSARWMCPA